MHAGSEILNAEHLEAKENSYLFRTSTNCIPANYQTSAISYQRGFHVGKIEISWKQQKLLLYVDSVVSFLLVPPICCIVPLFFHAVI